MPPRASLTSSRIEELSLSLQKMESTTNEAYHCCEFLTQRARQLDSLTSPASDASSMLSRANANLTATLVLMKDAREKFDTVTDCEPAIERLHKGVTELEETREAGGKTKGTFINRIKLTEQDVYAAADSMEILRDAYEYFAARSNWRSAPTTLGSIEGLHKMGLHAMSLLIKTKLKSAGPAIRPKRKIKDLAVVPPQDETAQEVCTTTTKKTSIPFII